MCRKKSLSDENISLLDEKYSDAVNNVHSRGDLWENLFERSEDCWIGSKLCTKSHFHWSDYLIGPQPSKLFSSICQATSIIPNPKSVAAAKRKKYGCWTHNMSSRYFARSPEQTFCVIQKNGMLNIIDRLLFGKARLCKRVRSQVWGFLFAKNKCFALRISICVASKTTKHSILQLIIIVKWTG